MSYSAGGFGSYSISDFGGGSGYVSYNTNTGSGGPGSGNYNYTSDTSMTNTTPMYSPNAYGGGSGLTNMSQLPSTSQLVKTYGSTLGNAISKALNYQGSGFANTIGNALFGSGGKTSVTTNPFSSGWSQIFSNGLVIVIGLILLIASFKTVPVVNTTVNLTKSAVKAAS